MKADDLKSYVLVKMQVLMMLFLLGDRILVTQYNLYHKLRNRFCNIGFTQAICIAHRLKILRINAQVQ